MAMAAARGATAGQLAIAWLLHKGDDIVPIPGTKRRRYLEENVAAAELRLSAQELRRRHLPMTTQFIPLLERGQKEGVFRADVSATWLIAVVRAIVHAASTELQVGRLSEAEVEQTMLTTALAAVSPRRP